jgi:HK97 gp10 family phage protein
MATEYVQGMSELLRKLRELPKKLENEIIDAALYDGGLPMLDRAKSLVPVDTGKLRDSLKIVTAPRRKNSHLVRVGTDAGDYAGETFYGSFIEYGYKRGARKSHRKMTEAQKAADTRPAVPAQPYLRPAFDENVNDSIYLIGRHIATAIELAVK